MNANKAFAARGTNEVRTFIPTYSEESILRLRKVRLNRRVNKKRMISSRAKLHT